MQNKQACHLRNVFVCDSCLESILPPSVYAEQETAWDTVKFPVRETIGMSVGFPYGKCSKYPVGIGPGSIDFRHRRLGKRAGCSD